MRIAFVGSRGIPGLYGGFETAITEISSRLVERGHDVIVYCRNGYGDRSEVSYKGVKKIYLPRIKLELADTLSHTFLSLIHLLRNQPDVIIVVNTANSPICILPRLAGIPFAVHAGGLEWRRTKWPLIGRVYIYCSAWFSTKIAPAVIADSTGIKEYYRDKWKRNTFYAAYGAYQERSTKSELLDKFGLVKDEYFLVVARLQPSNNTHLIVEAFSRVRTDKKLVIVGGVEYNSRYVRALRKKTNVSRIQFLGAIYDQESLTEIMCNCFSYVHGHEVGGTNPVLLKALGCGSCILYLDVGYRFNTRVVVDYGIPFQKDADDLRKQMQELADYPERANIYRERAPKRIEEAYTWDHVTDRYEELCSELSQNRNKKPRCTRSV
jgi:glycosyltransferase involved in cell wall biosynthesis